MINSVYAGLSLAELKALQKLHKKNPESLVAIEQAIKSMMTHTAGRLKDEQMSTVADALTSVFSEESLSQIQRAKIENALAILSTFKIDGQVATAPTPPEESAPAPQEPSAEGVVAAASATAA